MDSEVLEQRKSCTRGSLIYSSVNNGPGPLLEIDIPPGKHLDGGDFLNKNIAIYGHGGSIVKNCMFGNTRPPETTDEESLAQFDEMQMLRSDFRWLQIDLARAREKQYIYRMMLFLAGFAVGEAVALVIVHFTGLNP